jgi:hypothetical protein
MGSTLHPLLTLVLALPIPFGWTPVGGDRALLSPGDPSRGELWELPVAGSQPSREILTDALRRFGYTASVLDEGQGNTLRLSLGNGLLAWARPLPAVDRTTWFLVMASEDAARGLDVNALLSMVTVPSPETLSGFGTPEVLPGGGDSARSAGGWGAAASESASNPWAIQPAPALRAELFGLWKASTERHGQPCELTLRFEATGRARLERQGAQGSWLLDGTWSVHDDELRITGFNGEEIRSPWSLQRDGLQMALEGRVVTFERR